MAEAKAAQTYGDDVAVKREKLRLAAEGGTLSNEHKFRRNLEEFQQRNPGKDPIVVDISTPAQQAFQGDVNKLRYLEKETTNSEVRQLSAILIRALGYLGAQVE